MTDVEQELATLKESHEVLATERDGLKTQVEATEAANAKRDAQTAVAALIADAELPDATKVRLTEQFKEADSVDGVADAIAASGKELAALREAGQIKGLGNTAPATVPDDTVANVIESRTQYYIKQGKPPEQAAQMAVDYVKGE